jgi:hypothetical protein
MIFKHILKRELADNVTIENEEMLAIRVSLQNLSR